MIESFNEEEVSQLIDKIYILKECVRLRKLGYEYSKGSYIYTQLYDPNGYYEYASDTEILKTLLGNSIGSGDCCCTEEMQDIIREIGGIIPYSKYESEEICGNTIHINSDLTDFIFQNEIDISTTIQNFTTIFSEHICWTDETTYNDPQIIYDDKKGTGIYIITADNYFDINYVFITYVDFLESLHEKVEKFKEGNINVNNN